MPVTTSVRRPVIALLALAIYLCCAVPARADLARDQFAVAAAHYSGRRWQLAADEFQAFLQQFPLHERAASARFFRGEALLQLRQLEEARREFRRYVEHFSTGEYARQASYRVGEIGYLLGDGKQARSDLQIFLRKYPGDALNAQVLVYLDQLSFDAGDLQAAVRHCQQALQDYPESELAPACRFGLARALEKDGQTAEAIQHFQQIVDQRGDLRGESLLHLAACHYASSNYDAALTALEALGREPSKSNLHERSTLLRGWTLFQLERYDEAAQQFSAIADTQEYAPEAQYWLGLSQKKLDRWDQAAETLQSAIQRFPQSKSLAAMQYHAGDAFLLAGQLEQADAQFAAVAKSADSQWQGDALLGRARIALLRGELDRVEKLVAAYQQFDAQGPLQREFRRLQATAWINAGKMPQAIQLLQAQIESTEGDVAPEVRLLAQAQQRAGNHEQALQLLDQVPLDPTDSEAQLTRGLAHLGLEQYPQALSCLEGYTATKPTGSGAALALAEASYCHLKLGDVASARRLYDSLTAEFRTSSVIVPATQRLAELALASDELEFAQQLYAALAEQTDVPQAQQQGLFGLARIAFRQADYSDAIEHAAMLIERFPHGELLIEAQLLRAGALEKRGDFDAAQSLYREVFEQHAETPLAARALLTSARLHRRTQQSTEAAVLYQQLLERTDSVVGIDMVLYELAWLLRDSGQADQSDECFQRLHDEFRDSSYWPDATYRLAEHARVRGESVAAAQLLDELIASDQGQAIREFALYLRGQVAAERQQWDQVLSAMQRLASEHPDSKLVRQAQFWLAEAHYRQSQWNEAAERFEQLSTSAIENESWLAVVALRRAQIRAQREDWEGAFAIASQIADQHPSFRQQYEVDYLIGRCLANDARFDEAREAYRRATRSSTGGKSETAAMAQWMIGESYFHQKDYRTAIQEYLRVEILYAFPTWQAAALLQAGKCHELLNEHLQAYELYSQLMKRYPETQFAEEAARRLSLANNHSSHERT